MSGLGEGAMGKDGVPVGSLMVQKCLCEGKGFKCCVSVVVYGLRGCGCPVRFLQNVRSPHLPSPEFPGTK